MRSLSFLPSMTNLKPPDDFLTVKPCITTDWGPDAFSRTSYFCRSSKWEPMCRDMRFLRRGSAVSLERASSLKTLQKTVFVEIMSNKLYGSPASPLNSPLMSISLSFWMSIRVVHMGAILSEPGDRVFDVGFLMVRSLKWTAIASSYSICRGPNSSPSGEEDGSCTSGTSLFISWIGGGVRAVS